MKHLLLPLAWASFTASAQTTHLITAYDFAFDPLFLTVAPGDTIRLALGAGHGFREVPASAWYDNEPTPNIGYDIGPFPSYNDEHFIVLTLVDTLYYVCAQHLDMGMKGRIAVVEGPIGTQEHEAREQLWFPNPAHDRVFLIPPPNGLTTIHVTDQSGRSFIRPITSRGELDIQGLAPGLYMTALRPLGGGPVMRTRLAVE